jgi:hypothetical protein
MMPAIEMALCAFTLDHDPIVWLAVAQFPKVENDFCVLLIC